MTANRTALERREPADRRGYSLFARSDLLVAAFGALTMALAGAGLASWFGPGAGAAYADSYAVAQSAP